MVFGLFSKKKATKLVDELDEVYMTRARADLALVQAARSAELPVIVASFFPKSLERIERMLLQQALPCERLTARQGQQWVSASSPFASPRPCLLLDANEVAFGFNFEAWLLAASSPFSFLFVEHFPKWSTERSVLDVLEQGSANAAQRVRFFVGLDEPLMRAFDGAKIAGLMQKLGLSEDEKVTHSLIDKALVNAQKKLDQRVPNHSRADSDEEWFRLHVG